MKNYIQPGTVITLAAPYTVTSGQGAQVGSIFGVASADYTSGADGEFEIEGVFELAKATGTAWVPGQKIYWDNSAKVATAVAATNILIGNATLAAASGDALGTVRLGGGAGGATGFTIFQSTEQTGTGSSQNVAHGLGVVPTVVIVYPTDTAPATVGVYTMVEGTHTTTNVVVTVTSGKKFKVVAMG
jgi:predicted RecA/RadA family phage recombinase